LFGNITTNQWVCVLNRVVITVLLGSMIIDVFLKIGIVFLGIPKLIG
jgi:hypothetical protein